MKITKEYLRDLIKEELEEVTAPPPIGANLGVSAATQKAKAGIEAAKAVTLGGAGDKPVTVPAKVIGSCIRILGASQDPKAQQVVGMLKDAYNKAVGR